MSSRLEEINREINYLRNKITRKEQTIIEKEKEASAEIKFIKAEIAEIKNQINTFDNDHPYKLALQNALVGKDKKETAIKNDLIAMRNELAVAESQMPELLKERRECGVSVRARQQRECELKL